MRVRGPSNLLSMCMVTKKVTETKDVLLQEMEMGRLGRCFILMQLYRQD